MPEATIEKMPEETREQRHDRWRRADKAKADAEISSPLEIVTDREWVFGGDGNTQIVIPKGTAIARLPHHPRFQAEIRSNEDGSELPCPVGGYQVTPRQLRKMIAGDLAVRILPPDRSPPKK